MSDLYVCPICEERFQLVRLAQADASLEEKGLALTVVHDHKDNIWRAVLSQKRERKTDQAKLIMEMKREMRTKEREYAAEQQKALKERADLYRRYYGQPPEEKRNAV
jgi:uncharacterized Zn finger protein (UPF0148 family)